MGVAANERLTASTAAILLVMLAVEGATVLRVRSLFTLHVALGLILVPPIAVKIGSTLWRFARYYLGSRDYRRKGPPHPVLRLLGPVLVMVTVVLFATGIVGVFGPLSERSTMMQLHRLSFVLWFGCMTIHVLAHARETALESWRDWIPSRRFRMAGAGWRRFALSLSLLGGILLAVLAVPHASHFFGGH